MFVGLSWKCVGNKKDKDHIHLMYLIFIIIIFIILEAIITDLIQMVLNKFEKNWKKGGISLKDSNVPSSIHGLLNDKNISFKSFQVIVQLDQFFKQDVFCLFDHFRIFFSQNFNIQVRCNIFSFPSKLNQVNYDIIFVVVVILIATQPNKHSQKELHIK